MLERLFDIVGSLGGPWAYLAVGLLAAGESSLGVGLVVPGETGMIVGGFIVSQGNATLWSMILVAVGGAIVGDSIGYEIGRHFGPRLRRTRLGRFIGEERWQQAEGYLARRGGRAVFFGRFVAVVRSLVPALAGAGRMPYRRFLLYNALGAMLWGSMFVTIGYFAGRSYDRVASAIEGAGWVVLASLFVIAVIVVASRWVVHHPDEARAALDRAAHWRPVAWVRRTFPRTVRFVQKRFQIHHAFGLSLTIGLVFLVATGWLFGLVVNDVLGRDGIVRIDRPSARYFADHRAESVTAVMRVISALGDLNVLVVIAVVVGVGWLLATRRWGVLLFLGVTIAGALLLSNTVKELVERPRPPVAFREVEVHTLSFPSGHAVHATAFYLALAYIHGSVVRRWSLRVAIWASAMTLSLFVAFARVYLGAHWLTDVVGGVALGAVWVAVVTTAFGASTRLARQYADGRRREEDATTPDVDSEALTGRQ